MAVPRDGFPKALYKLYEWLDNNFPDITAFAARITAVEADVAAAQTALGMTNASVPDGVGAAAGTGVVATERGSGVLHKTVLTLTNTPVVLADNAGVIAYGGLKIYDLPAGNIVFMGASTDLAVTKSSTGVNADWDGDFALGTVTASNNNSLSSTEQNLIPSTATPQAVAGATTADGVSTATEIATVVGTFASPADVFINFLVDDTDHNVAGTACNLILNGTVTLHWLNLDDLT